MAVGELAYGLLDYGGRYDWTWWTSGNNADTLANTLEPAQPPEEDQSGDDQHRPARASTSRSSTTASRAGTPAG